MVGVLGDHRTGPIGSIGDAMGALFIATLIPVMFIGWRYITETRGLDLTALDEAVIWAESKAGEEVPAP